MTAGGFITGGLAVVAVIAALVGAPVVVTVAVLAFAICACKFVA